MTRHYENLYNYVSSFGWRCWWDGWSYLRGCGGRMVQRRVWDNLLWRCRVGLGDLLVLILLYRIWSYWVGRVVRGTFGLRMNCLVWLWVGLGWRWWWWWWLGVVVVVGGGRIGGGFIVRLGIRIDGYLCLDWHLLLLVARHTCLQIETLISYCIYYN